VYLKKDVGVREEGDEKDDDFFEKIIDE